MKKYKNKTPEEVIKLVTSELIVRSIKLGKQKNRTIFISKTSGGTGVDVNSLSPNTKDGKENFDNFFYNN